MRKAAASAMPVDLVSAEIKETSEVFTSEVLEYKRLYN